ncbi:MAG: type II secretion system secretin GspD [Deltaproteobacteria bacterium]|nr:type II secretion system secretin GspD [Deltaproteobacteria bacterium]
MNLNNIKLKQGIYRLLVVVSLLVVGFILTTSSFAQTKEKRDDFGTELLEDLEPPIPLPVEMVEEKPSAPLEFQTSTEKQQTDETSESGSITTILDVRDADLTALVKAISKATKRNFIIDNRLKGKVTVHLPTPVSQADALKIFDSVLLLNGFTTVPAGKNLWKILPTKEAKQSTIPLVNEDLKDRSDVLVTELLQLKYIKAEEMQQLLSQFISADGGINSFAGTNSMLVIDSARNIARVRSLIDQLDVPAKDQDITIIPVLFAEAKDVAEKVQQILGEESKDGATGQSATAQALQTGQPGVPRPSKSTIKVAQGQNVSARALPIKIIPDERTNSIIVVADPEMTTKVRVLCQRLDSEIDRSGGRFYVYRLKHADAEDLSEILNGLISGSPVSSKKKDNSGSSLSRSRSGFGSGFGSGNEGSYSGSTSRNRSSRSRQSGSGYESTRETPTRTTSTGGGGAQTGTGKVNFEGEIMIAADSSTNSLIISASKGDYQRVKEVIEELDVKRRQVLVEATILEVGMTKDEGLGIELQMSGGNDDGGAIAQTNWGGLTNLVKNPAALSDLTIAAASTGTITLPGGLVIPSQAVLVSALSANSNVNVLSTPTILSTDNEEAEIVVGENVPFVTGTSKDSTNLNSTFNEIERQDVGITLRITPQISSNNYVLLKIFIEISNVVPGTRNDPNGPSTTIRTTETTVEVKSNQMIVTGGLLADSITESTRGIPYIQDIPVLGQLFQRNDQNMRRNNLLVFLTPRIIFDQYEARDQGKRLIEKVEKVIDENDVYPDRKEVLHADNLDRVAEENTEAIEIPSTITSPNNSMPMSPEAKAALERTKHRFSALAKEEASAQPEIKETVISPTSVRESENTEDEISYTVKPKLPAAETKPVTDRSEYSYIVLRETEHNVDSKLLKYADQLGTVGIKIPGKLRAEDSGSFRAGGRYVFNDQGVERSFVVLGNFNSPEEASRIDQNLGRDALWNKMTEQTQFNWTAQ